MTRYRVTGVFFHNDFWGINVAGGTLIRLVTWRKEVKYTLIK